MSGDLCGLRAEEAEARVAAEGRTSCRVLTGPPWSGHGTGVLRVVRVRRMAGEQVELVVAWEGYRRTAGTRSAGPDRS